MGSFSFFIEIIISYFDHSETLIYTQTLDPNKMTTNTGNITKQLKLFVVRWKIVYGFWASEKEKVSYFAISHWLLMRYAYWFFDIARTYIYMNYTIYMYVKRTLDALLLIVIIHNSAILVLSFFSSRFRFVLRNRSKRRIRSYIYSYSWCIKLKSKHK